MFTVGITPLNKAIINRILLSTVSTALVEN